MSPKKKSVLSENKSISISGDVKNSNVIIGDNNTFIKKIFNIFKSDSETLEQRNRRILLGHVENAWIKGVLDASLHGAALLDLGIKQDPEAVTQYPWAIKRESTDETIPAGTSMLDIFDSIGMGRSLLILGAPGSGKTTMLLELARGLIARAREDVTQPIPMVFNLASWTEILTLADWLAQELNNLYSVPRKTAPDWVKGNKLLLLLDGLDEVRQDSRVKCVEAINEFRKQNGLTSLAVCSRSQDYADLKAKLSFEGAIEVQPLTQEQIAEFFSRFGDEMAGIKQSLEKDSGLRELAETPLFLSIMSIAYRDKRNVEILALGDEMAQRKYLFDTYIQQMFKRITKNNNFFSSQDTERWLSWLAYKMIEQGHSIFLLEKIKRGWLENQAQSRAQKIVSGSIIFTIIIIIPFVFHQTFAVTPNFVLGALVGLFLGVISGLSSSVIEEPSEVFKWSISNFKQRLQNFPIRVFLVVQMVIVLISGIVIAKRFDFLTGLLFVFFIEVVIATEAGMVLASIEKRAIPNQGIFQSAKNGLIAGLLFGLGIGTIFWNVLGFINALEFILLFTVGTWFVFGGFAVINHYVLRFLFSYFNFMRFDAVPFLNHCVDLIFLRRVGGGYIFVHRLLMEHFAEMYVETPTSKGN